MSEIKDLTENVIKFRNERDWQQFHKPKEIAISIALEASEVLEHFQWKDEEEVKKYITTHKEDISDELADVFNYVLVMSHDLGIDIAEASRKKIAKNAQKYPVEKSKGKYTKYNEL